MVNLFDDLFDQTTSNESIDEIVRLNINALRDFINIPFAQIKNHRNSIEKFLLLRTASIRSLDFSKSYNKAFVSVLMDLCERFNFFAATPRIFSILEENKINVGLRLEAALLYLINIDSNSCLVDRFEPICQRLESALDCEEDNEYKVVFSFLNYFGNLIQNAPLKYCTLVKEKSQLAIQKNEYKFLSNKFIQNALAISLDNQGNAYFQLQQILDSLLSQVSVFPFFLEDGQTVEIESDTEYSNSLVQVEKTFNSIRKLSVRNYSALTDREEAFDSLGRGVAVLINESQLFSYMNSYGNCHYAKLFEALKRLPEISTQKNIEVFDWGCGQGIGSMAFLEFIRSKKNSSLIKRITLIEPSLVAIKRAGLHIRFFNEDIKIKTVCKDFDSLTISDVESDSSLVKVHIFSNILDVDLFSISKLLSLIEMSQKGLNFFICVSPYLNDVKADRVDSFKRFFEEKDIDKFELYSSKENKKDIHNYWLCNKKFNGDLCPNHPYGCGGRSMWTRQERVFRVFL